MNARRKAILLSALGAVALYIILIIGPATAGHITGEQPTTAFAAK